MDRLLLLAVTLAGGATLGTSCLPTAVTCTPDEVGLGDAPTASTRAPSFSGCPRDGRLELFTSESDFAETGLSDESGVDWASERLLLVSVPVGIAFIVEDGDTLVVGEERACDTVELVCRAFIVATTLNVAELVTCPDACP